MRKAGMYGKLTYFKKQCRNSAAGTFAIWMDFVSNILSSN
jgi:hypothetical protein